MPASGLVTDPSALSLADYTSPGLIVPTLRGVDTPSVIQELSAALQREGRITEINDFRIEAIPRGYMLVMHNRDVPGVIGRVGTILGEAGISFLGFGIQPPTASWGNMLTNSLDYVGRAWWLVAAPGAAISLAVLCVFLIADGLRDALDPRLTR